MNAEPEPKEDSEEEEDRSLELDLYQAKHLVHRCQREPDDFARDLYRGLCNTTWKHVETGQTYSCSWRYAGGIVSTMAYGVDEYMMFYTSGNEGIVTDDVLTELVKLGWEPTDDLQTQGDN